MPPTHPSQADVAAAYRTLIAHETEPKEQDFYRDRLQRLEQATEPECEFDCRSRVAAAGVGVYCPQCSAKCAETDLTTQLAKAIRAAWVDRLDWDELAQGALEFLTSAGRLIPSGGMSLTAEQVEDVRTVVSADAAAWNRLSPALFAAYRLRRALFPATEPAEVSGNIFAEGNSSPAPAEPAEVETKAELCAVRLCVLPARHSGVHADREGLRWNNPTSSPVVPAPTETEWQTCGHVPIGIVFRSKDRHPAFTWVNEGGSLLSVRNECEDGHFSDGEHCLPSMVDENFAPFVAAEEG